jgi:hypothetical protein
MGPRVPNLEIDLALSGTLGFKKVNRGEVKAKGSALNHAGFLLSHRRCNSALRFVAEHTGAPQAKRLETRTNTNAILAPLGCTAPLTNRKWRGGFFSAQMTTYSINFILAVVRRVARGPGCP